ncbi:C2H2 finger domain-containing protein [Apiospora hydei]|uniref:C2H2 finger domain-containing protein n=1 Tax=Apiospora hydei TaxID=1337664 RepID=A0ABR1X860_9PEZI
MGIKNKRTLTKTRRHLRDLDQIKADLLSPRHLEQYKETKATDDLPDLGKWYCIECAKWFESERNMLFHQKGKPHKRRVKQMKEEPYTQREAEAAAGLGVCNEAPSKPAAADEDEAMMT